MKILGTAEIEPKNTKLASLRVICLKRMKTFYRRLSGGGHQLAFYSCLGTPLSSVDASKLENERYGRVISGADPGIFD